MSKPKWTPIKVRLGEIRAWSDNPRLSTKAQALRIIESENKFGQPVPFLLMPMDGNKYPLIDGHQRLAAWLTAYGDDYAMDAMVSDRALTEDEHKEMVITLHTGATGSWDWNALSSWDAGELQGWGMDTDALKDWNNDANNLKELLAAEVETVDAEPQIDRAEELLEKWGVETGDLWHIGEHRLICGDCTDKATVERLMDWEKADILFSSPPYNQGNSSGDLATNRKGSVKLYEEFADDMSAEDYRELIFGCLEKSLSIMGDVHSVVWNVSYNAKSRDDYGIILFSERNPFSIFETIVWDKGGALNIGHSGIYSRRCELVFVMSAGDKYRTSHKEGETRWNYWSFSKEAQTKEHRAAFPLAFAEHSIKEFSFDDDICYEPFCGTGTTMVASQNLSRRCYAAEIAPKYVAVCLERMAQAFPELQIYKADTP